MTPELEYASRYFDREDGTVEIPDDAIGITVGTFGDRAIARFLQPVERGDES